MLQGRGVIASKPTILEARPLNRADLARLPAPRAESGQALKLRNHHHRIARLDAMGLKNYEVCQICGITDARLQQLRKTPAYVELVSLYRREIIQESAQQVDEYQREAMTNMLRMELQVKDHLDEAEESGELIPLKTLFSGIADRADRFGYPKGSVVAKINVGNQLERAMQRSGRTIVVDAKGSPPLVSSSAESQAPADSAETSPARVSRRGY